eukprot:c21861_g1_i2.p1 GENE.c21861_g1_i2~~c21861_g1_i2.p1  ORF type:complete len:680 (-),score=81.50 c21861_g1_i2:256-2295(-)
MKTILNQFMKEKPKPKTIRDVFKRLNQQNYCFWSKNNDEIVIKDLNYFLNSNHEQQSIEKSDIYFQICFVIRNILKESSSPSASPSPLKSYMTIHELHNCFIKSNKKNNKLSFCGNCCLQKKIKRALRLLDSNGEIVWKEGMDIIVIDNSWLLKLVMPIRMLSHYEKIKKNSSNRLNIDEFKKWIDIDAIDNKDNDDKRKLLENGILTWEMAKILFKSCVDSNSDFDESLEKCLDLLSLFQVIKELSSTKEFLVPSLLPEEPVENFSKISKRDISDKRSHKRLYTFEYLPEDFFHSLVCDFAGGQYEGHYWFDACLVKRTFQKNEKEYTEELYLKNKSLKNLYLKNKLTEIRLTIFKNNIDNNYNNDDGIEYIILFEEVLYRLLASYSENVSNPKSIQISCPNIKCSKKLELADILKQRYPVCSKNHCYDRDLWIYGKGKVIERFEKDINKEKDGNETEPVAEENRIINCHDHDNSFHDFYICYPVDIHQEEADSIFWLLNDRSIANYYEVNNNHSQKKTSVFFDQNCLRLSSNNPPFHLLMETCSIIIILISKYSLNNFRSADETSNNHLLEIETALKLSDEKKCKILVCMVAENLFLSVDSVFGRYKKKLDQQEVIKNLPEKKHCHKDSKTNRSIQETIQILLDSSKSQHFLADKRQLNFLKYSIALLMSRKRARSE